MIHWSLLFPLICSNTTSVMTQVPINMWSTSGSPTQFHALCLPLLIINLSTWQDNLSLLILPLEYPNSFTKTKRKCVHFYRKKMLDFNYYCPWVTVLVVRSKENLKKNFFSSEERRQSHPTHSEVTFQQPPMSRKQAEGTRGLWEAIDTPESLHEITCCHRRTSRPPSAPAPFYPSHCSKKLDYLVSQPTAK